MHSRILDLERRTRNRLLARSVARILVTDLVLVAVYIVLPVRGATDARAIAILVAGLVAVPATLFWQIRSILRADFPIRRAIEALAVAAPLLIVVFSLVYLSLSLADRANFSEHLDRISAVYFTVSVLSTAGFGDITARTDPARLTVTIQLLLDIVLVAAVVRLFFGTARAALGGKQGT